MDIYRDGILLCLSVFISIFIDSELLIETVSFEKKYISKSEGCVIFRASFDNFILKRILKENVREFDVSK